jgi:protein-disulfide isomerase
MKLLLPFFCWRSSPFPCPRSAGSRQRLCRHLPAQPVSVKKGQVEVLEFFWYRCPHCFNLEPDLKAWIKKQPKHVVIKRVPAILNPDWDAMARAYYALEALGLHDKLHEDLFKAIPRARHGPDS